MAYAGSDAAIQDLARRRWRVAIVLTLAMVALYFGFILLVAFNKPLLGRLISPGLSLGVLFGALVIVLSWILTWIYVRWANTHYDSALDDLRSGGGGEGEGDHANDPIPDCCGPGHAHRRT